MFTRVGVVSGPFSSARAKDHLRSRCEAQGGLDWPVYEWLNFPRSSPVRNLHRHSQYTQKHRKHSRHRLACYHAQRPHPRGRGHAKNFSKHGARPVQNIWDFLLFVCAVRVPTSPTEITHRRARLLVTQYTLSKSVCSCTKWRSIEAQWMWGYECNIQRASYKTIQQKSEN